jgi:hypothetical protein
MSSALIILITIIALTVVLGIRSFLCSKKPIEFMIRVDYRKAIDEYLAEAKVTTIDISNDFLKINPACFCSTGINICLIPVGRNFNKVLRYAKKNGLSPANTFIAAAYIANNKVSLKDKQIISPVIIAGKLAVFGHSFDHLNATETSELGAYSADTIGLKGDLAIFVKE